MANLFLLNGSNWKEFFNRKICFVMFSKTSCEHCEMLERSINGQDFNQKITMTKLQLDTPGFSELKQTHPWISRIDTLPFNTVFSEGQLIDSWSGSNFETLLDRLSEFLL